MSHSDQKELHLSMNPVALSSYAVATCSFAAAALGLVVSHIPSGELAAVGVFYLVVGLIYRSTMKSEQIQEPAHRVNGHASGAENLVAEAIPTTRDPVPSRQRELAGTAR